MKVIVMICLLATTGVLALPTSCLELNRFLCNSITDCSWNYEKTLCAEKEIPLIDNFRVLLPNPNNPNAPPGQYGYSTPPTQTPPTTQTPPASSGKTTTTPPANTSATSTGNGNGAPPTQGTSTTSGGPPSGKKI